ncbi:MAG: serine/threonine-protein kinase, partial [Roseimicrobium sp.]
MALKLLAPEREKDAAFAERFTREAQALAVLSHPHIVTIYDFGVTSQAGGAGDGAYYLLMEYVDGVNLRQLLDQRKLTAEEALAIVPPLCDALQFAHERGIVHRDIKPENLLLDKRGRVKIADFGIAKMLGNGTPSHTIGGTLVEPVPVPLGVTQPETAMGTPAYMAPEQASAPEKVDSRADIYSLGVVFYEMLTGELPARQLDAAGARMRNLHIDVRLDEIVLRALEKKPEMRWQTAADLRTRVEAVSSAASASTLAAESSPPPSAASRPTPLPFHPWMQRFVARSVGSRRRLLWCLLIAGTLLTTLFMMPVQTHSIHTGPIVPGNQKDLLISKEEWESGGHFGVPDGWFIVTTRQYGVPVLSADGKAVGRTVVGTSQLEREVRPFTVSYAMGLIAAALWIAFWYYLSAEQRAGDRLPADQRAFAAPLTDRSRGVRIRWGRLLIILVAFLGTTVVLSGHMSAIMMMVLGDAPHPIFNAIFTTFFLSFVLIKGLARELAGEPPAAGSARGEAAAIPYARACGLTAVAAGTVMAFVSPFLVYGLNEVFAGRVKERFLISVFLVTWGVSISVVHWLLSRRKLSEAATRRALRAMSIAGWIVFLPVVTLAVFFLLGLARDVSGWNPTSSEAFIVPLICLGSLLLPLAAWYLRCVSGLHPMQDGPPRRSAGRVVLGIFLVLAAIGLPVVTVGFQFIGVAN